MPRYIDAEELWIQLDKLDSFEQGRNHAYYKGLRKAKRILSEQPTADVVERKKGKWEYVDDVDYRCSVCHKYAYGCLGEVLSGQYKHCPYCGAEMEKTDD